MRLEYNGGYLRTTQKTGVSFGVLVVAAMKKY